MVCRQSSQQHSTAQARTAYSAAQHQHSMSWHMKGLVRTCQWCSTLIAVPCMSLCTVLRIFSLCWYAPHHVAHVCLASVRTGSCATCATICCSSLRSRACCLQPANAPARTRFSMRLTLVTILALHGSVQQLCASTRRTDKTSTASIRMAFHQLMKIVCMYETDRQD